MSLLRDSIFFAGAGFVAIALIGLFATTAWGGQLQLPWLACPEDPDSTVEAGWTQYRQGDMAAAERHFRLIDRRCEEHVGARVGLGYVALRTGEDARARSLFRSIVTRDAAIVDAWVGLGILAWRAAELEDAGEAFRRALALAPDHAEAREYLARMPAGLGEPPERPTLILPDTVEHVVRTHGDRFEVRNAAGGWEPFYIKGVNLGAALPGRYPSEFPVAEIYRGWIEQMAAAGINAVRVYTIHPPHFYGALAAHNERHPDAPLWLIHGVWTELPPGDDFMDPAWEGDYFAEMRRVVDVLHGRADLRPRPGHASGHYTADVSRWTLGIILGREWEPYAVLGFEDLRPDLTRWSGRYLTVAEGSPMEVWLARASEEIIAYETETYRTQRPVAYTNWPTLDPMHHVTEATAREQVGLFAALGEPAGQVEEGHAYDDDAIGLDATRAVPTAAFPAGTFAAFHAYPYYPDYMVLDPEYAQARSSLGRSSYFGYLERLKRYHRDIPVVIAEYGVPSSLGNAHFQPQGWNHGGLDEERSAAINDRMTREIAEAGMAGGLLFAWIDEWFKRNWLVTDFAMPHDRNRLWLNRLDPEQQYGVVAIESDPPFQGSRMRDRLQEWRSRPALYSTSDATIRVETDASYLWLLVEPSAPSEEVLVGFDTVDPDAGAFRWPERASRSLPVGIEFVLRVQGDTVRLMAAPGSNPIRVEEHRAMAPLPADVRIDEAPVGMFQGRFSYSHARPLRSRVSRDGMFEALRVVTNPRRVGRDTTEHLAIGYDRGILPFGPPASGTWERGPEGEVEVRIPWMLLNVSDPSSRSILQDGPGNPLPAEIPTVQVDGIRIVAAGRDRAGSWWSLPASGRASDVALFTWDTWEEPAWRARPRPLYERLPHLFDSLTPKVMYR